MTGIDPVEESVAALLIGNMDKDGYLQLDDRGHRLPERPGLRRRRARAAPHPGARPARRRRPRPARVPAAAARAPTARRTRSPRAIVRDHLSLLESKRYDKIAKELGVHDRGGGGGRQLHRHARAQAGPQLRRGRHPLHHPGRLRAEGRRRATSSPSTTTACRACGSATSTARCSATPDTSDAKRYIQEKMRAAAWLIKSIQQRQRTLFLVTHEHRHASSASSSTTASRTSSRWC